MMSELVVRRAHEILTFNQSCSESQLSNDSLCGSAMACCMHLCRAWDTLGISFSSTQLLDETVVALTNVANFLIMQCLDSKNEEG